MRTTWATRGCVMSKRPCIAFAWSQQVSLVGTSDADERGMFHMPAAQTCFSICTLRDGKHDQGGDRQEMTAAEDGGGNGPNAGVSDGAQVCGWGGGSQG